MAFLVLRAGLGATPPSAATLAAAQAFLNNELYIGRLVWNLTYLKDPKSGRGRSRYNPPAKWIVQDVLNSDDVFPVRPRTIPCSVSEIPCSDFKGIGGNTLNLLANAMAASPSPASSGKISLYFPAEQGIPRTETGSPMTSERGPLARGLEPHNGFLLLGQLVGVLLANAPRIEVTVQVLVQVQYLKTNLVPTSCATFVAAFLATFVAAFLAAFYAAFFVTFFAPLLQTFFAPVVLAVSETFFV